LKCDILKYNIRALSADHAVSHLLIDAVDEIDARRQVSEQGLFVTSIAQRGISLGAWLPMARQDRPALSLVLFSQELLALLKAGLGIVEALEALVEKEASPGLRQVLTRLLGGLRDGKRLSVVLSEQGSIFPPLYLGVVRAAEGTSDLPRSLQRYIDYQLRIDAARSKVVSAAIYPVILISVGTAVSFFLMAYVVPRFAEVYKGAGRELPWMSALLLGWGEFVSQYASWLLIAAGIAGAGFVVLWRHFKARGGWTFLFGQLPGVGERVRVYELSRLYLTLGMLLEGGIALIPAMDTIGEVVSPTVGKRLLKAKTMIQSGVPLSEAFFSQQLTTSISLRMLAVGERSGDMGAMLTQSAEFYDGEITRWIDRFMRSFEPMLMAAIGLVVGVIVVLLYMPIFDLAGSF
jgi:general secretion pathway protein F